MLEGLAFWVVGEEGDLLGLAGDGCVLHTVGDSFLFLDVYVFLEF